LKKLISTAAKVLVFAAASFSVANASTITIYDGSTAIGTLTDGKAGTTFEGFFGTTPATASLNTSKATAFHLANSNPSTETSTLQTILGSTAFSTTSNDTSHAGATVSWNEGADYFLLKTGGGTLVAYFYNTTGADLDLTYTQASGRYGGRGLSHTADFTSSVVPAVPEPATWAMLMLGLRRRALLA